jgi:hypothetical protein
VWCGTSEGIYCLLTQGREVMALMTNPSFRDMMTCGLVDIRNVSEEPVASIFRAEDTKKIILFRAKTT